MLAHSTCKAFLFLIPAASYLFQQTPVFDTSCLLTHTLAQMLPWFADKRAVDWLQIFWDVFEGRWGNGKASLVLSIIPLMASFLAGASSVASNSRMLFAFSRDGAVPGSKIWAHINPYFKVSWGLVCCWLMINCMCLVVGGCRCGLEEYEANILQTKLL